MSKTKLELEKESREYGKLVFSLNENSHIDPISRLVAHLAIVEQNLLEIDPGEKDVVISTMTTMVNEVAKNCVEYYCDKQGIE